MFEVYCPAHQSAVLLSSSRITALHNHPDGMVVEWRCWCGHHGESAHGRSRSDHIDHVDHIDAPGDPQPALPEAS